MKVAQRGTSFTSVSSTQYTLDRWQLEFNGSPGAVVTVTQSTDAATSLSFWVKSPKAGAHCVALYMDDGSAHNVQEFVVSAADAWELKHIAFPGCPTWSIADDNGAVRSWGGSSEPPLL